MTIYEVDPLTDPRWIDLLRSHPSASMFHSPEWLKSLQRTYGYKPSILTTSEPNSELTNGLVFCRVNSWLTGRRLVSLPFSDHCEPLANNEDDLFCLMDALKRRAKEDHCKYVELRPVSALAGAQSGFHASQSFHFHRLDLRSGEGDVFRRFHKDCIQRKIHRAEKEDLSISEGRDPETLRQFYRLLLLTRRRHGLPPQPVSWYRNLLECLGDSALIRLAKKDNQPIGGILTIRYGKTLYYKYGASDANFHSCGAMPCLYWVAIRDAIRQGLEFLDMGRSDSDNPGLIAFKNHWGATSTILSYWKYPGQALPRQSNASWDHRLLREASGYMPDFALTSLGTLLYRHWA